MKERSKQIFFHISRDQGDIQSYVAELESLLDEYREFVSNITPINPDVTDQITKLLSKSHRIIGPTKKVSTRL